MKNKFWILFLLFFGCSVKFDRVAEEKAIQEVLKAQEIAWNQGDIDEFMEGYWKSDSLMFVGSGIIQGWDGTIARYHKNYPDREAMGQLDFTFFDFRFIDEESCLVTGKYHLKRTADDISGMFTLLVKKIKGKWLVAYDHTS